MFVNSLRFKIVPIKVLCCNLSFTQKLRNVKISLPNGIRWNHLVELTYYLIQTPDASELILMNVYETGRTDL